MVPFYAILSIIEEDDSGKLICEITLYYLHYGILDIVSRSKLRLSMNLYGDRLSHNGSQRIAD